MHISAGQAIVALSLPEAITGAGVAGVATAASATASGVCGGRMARSSSVRSEKRVSQGVSSGVACGASAGLLVCRGASAGANPLIRDHRRRVRLVQSCGRDPASLSASTQGTPGNRIFTAELLCFRVRGRTTLPPPEAVRILEWDSRVLCPPSLLNYRSSDSTLLLMELAEDFSHFVCEHSNHFCKDQRGTEI